MKPTVKGKMIQTDDKEASNIESGVTRIEIWKPKPKPIIKPNTPVTQLPVVGAALEYFDLVGRSIKNSPITSTKS